jgi:outer membrane receptor for ferric coprogen and ferric-rhodotorulic acid
VLNSEIQEQFQFQTDYVLPTGEGSQFEAGYKGNFNNLNKDYAIFSSDNGNNQTIFYNNTLEYKEKLMPLYSIWFQSK